MYRIAIRKTHRAIQCFCLQLISAYRFCISPVLGNHCRFYPTCSQYATDAFSTYSIFKAFYLTGRRLLRCHPFCKGGVDPLP